MIIKLGNKKELLDSIKNIFAQEKAKNLPSVNNSSIDFRLNLLKD